MRILFVGSRFSSHVTKPLLALQEAGHEVLLFDTCLLASSKNENPFRSVWLSGYTHAQDQMDEIHKAFKPDIIHIHGIDRHSPVFFRTDIAPVVISACGLDVNWPVVFDEVGIPRFSGEQGPCFSDYLACLDMFPRAAAIIVDNLATINKCRLLGGEDVPIYNIPLGVGSAYFAIQDPVAIEHSRKQLGLAEQDCFFLSSRAFSKHYRHHNILEAFAAIATENSVLGFKLDGQGVFANTMGDPFEIRGDASFSNAQLPKQKNVDVLSQAAELIAYEQLLRNNAKKLGIENRVRFINPIDASLEPTLYGMADVLVNYPEQDSFPVTFAESAALGVRTVTNLLPAYKGTFVESCFDLVHEENTDALASAMQKAASEPYCVEKRQASRAAALLGFSFNTYMKSVVDIYENCASSFAKKAQKQHSNNVTSLISILIPYYKYEKFLHDCLQSLADQTYSNWEAIVIDDGSPTLEGQAIVEKFNDSRVTYLRIDQNQGKGRVLNIGFEKIQGEYVLILDADDMLMPSFFERCLAKMRDDPELDVVFTHFQLFGNKNDIWKYSPKTRFDMLVEQWIPGPGALMKRRVYDEAGGNYEGPELRYGNIDWDFWLSASRRKLKAGNIPETLYLYRLHGSSITDRRPRHDYITRECMYRRHSALFSAVGEGAQFLADGYINSARQAWNNKDPLRSLALAGRAWQLLQPNYTTLPAIDFSPEQQDILRKKLTLDLEGKRGAGLKATPQDIENRIYLALLYAYKNNIILAQNHFEIALGQLAGCGDWEFFMESALHLAVMLINSQQWEQAQDVLECLKKLVFYHPDVYSLLLHIALQQGKRALAYNIAFESMKLSGASYNALLQWGCFFASHGENLEKELSSLFRLLEQFDTASSFAVTEQSYKREDLLARCYASKFGRKIYWLHRAHDLYRQYGNSEGGVEALKVAFEEFSPSKVLEVGCGNGRLLSFFSGIPGVEFVGQDISATAIDFAQEKQLPNTKLFCCDVKELPYSDQYFDLVVCNRVLQHIQPELISAFLSEIARLGKRVFINEMAYAEAESKKSFYIFGHEYNKLFTALGMEQIRAYETKENVAFLYSHV